MNSKFPNSQCSIDSNEVLLFWHSMCDNYLQQQLKGCIGHCVLMLSAVKISRVSVSQLWAGGCIRRSICLRQPIPMAATKQKLQFKLFCNLNNNNIDHKSSTHCKYLNNN